MNIALVGYGKMGKEIEKIALERGHHILAKLSHSPTPSDLKNVEVAIEFSRPENAFNNLKTCIENNVAVVCGTTGWLDRKTEIEDLVHQQNGSFIYASNFSLGVNLFFEMARQTAKLMQPYSNYLLELEEIHHTEKKDAPSGTAITLAETIIANSDYKSWKLNEKTQEDEIPVFAKRIPEVPGTHSIKYISDEDQIELTHTANSRRGFALGAVVAAEYIVNKRGVFTMKDVLNIY